MAAWRRAIELAMAPDEVVKLTSIARSRTEPASRVERARMLLAYRDNPSFFAVAKHLVCIITPSSAASPLVRSKPWKIDRVRAGS